MDYYRKAAAVFILIMTLITPIFLENEGEVAVVEIKTLVEKSSYLNRAAVDSLKKEKQDQKAVKAEIMTVIKNSAAEYAAANNYSSVITKDLLYQGGENITEALAQKIDSRFKSKQHNF